jgi:hypothetical protein
VITLDQAISDYNRLIITLYKLPFSLNETSLRNLLTLPNLLYYLFDFSIRDLIKWLPLYIQSKVKLTGRALAKNASLE